MKKYKKVVLLFNLLLILAYVNWNIGKNETLLDVGDLVLLELGYVDIRSSMQGDYMRLNYQFLEVENIRELPKRAYCVVLVDSNRVASVVRYQNKKSPLEEGEKLIKYTKKDNRNLFIGADSFFFLEGQAEKYKKAKYVALKIDADGNSLLVGVYNATLQAI